jgi:hypothetical protein
VPGQFSREGRTDLLFYEGATGVAEFYATNNGRISLLAQHTNWRTNWTTIVPGVYAPLRGIRLHAKILMTPTNFSVQAMLASMREVYVRAGLRVLLGSTESLNLPNLLDLETGKCGSGFGDNITGEVADLYSNRRFVQGDDLVIYFIRDTTPESLNGCAHHPSGRPGAVVTAQASTWTLAHEVGHVLGLGHVDDNNRLMTGNGTDRITNPPPDLTAGEILDLVRDDLAFDL